ncbi:MAG: hypothetical protein UW21_C0021G0005 [Candidatus Woesebacteria bacterium GW2011_GWB1_44_11b]|uniref:Uncharacterized protein n=1 Tax=Candidatus Woesebacteria bacterium GW2011_GWB1_44_11b TaxID=1618580 RepID=A0A0G1GDH6_9BACT|nr:MAG: hypothetical protein UW21_C0021G0005 [Candidatus Woesebacteria bacterium GW2011_GWB1_44_11b]
MNVLGSFNTQLWELARYPALFALALYIIFALVVVRQIQLMTETLEVGFEMPIKLLGFFHLLFAVGIFVLALIVL